MTFENRRARRLMERMGVNMNQIPEVEEVVIRTSNKDMIIRDASVSEIIAKDMRVFQVMGRDIEEVQREKPKFTEEDVLLVSQQAGVSKERAEAALEDSEGDLAQAIMKLAD